MRATSKLRLAWGAKLSIRQTLAVVPPMSKESTFDRPFCLATKAEKIAPPAGPLSTRRMGNFAAVSMEVRPPPESIMKTGTAMPMASSPARRRAR